MLFFKKVKKLFKDPELFFHDYNIKKRAKNSLIIKKLGNSHIPYSTYTIVSAVYNVEKYLDDFFTSIINQSIGFEKSIQLIMVDDGSSDNSANIIKRYQKLYPNNITYIYKENGGQASARNLGLKYVKTPWVTFTDPDDFLDKDYFKNIDKMLVRDKNIAIVSSRMVLYYEDTERYIEHPLNYKFSDSNCIVNCSNIDKKIILSIGSTVINFNILKEISLTFDVNIKPVFEDALFINSFILNNFNYKVLYAKNSIYYYRKRKDGSSTIDNVVTNKQYYTSLLRLGYFKLIKESILRVGYVPFFIQYTILYSVFHQLKINLNNDYKNLNSSLMAIYIIRLKRIFNFIDIDTIERCSIPGITRYLKTGIINYFKEIDYNFNCIYLEKIDLLRDKISCIYYSNLKNIEINCPKINLNTIIKVSPYKIGEETLINRHHFWIDIALFKKYQYVIINGNRCKIKFNNKDFDLFPNELIQNKSKELRQKLDLGKWIISDRKDSADDNGEKFFCFLFNNKDKYEILSDIKFYFAIDKKSTSWDRLKNKYGQYIVDYNQVTFNNAINIISSYNPSNFGIKLQKEQNFIFLGHGVDKSDVSFVFNNQNIRLRTSTYHEEYFNIIKNGSYYHLGQEEVVLTGQARHDSLLANNKYENKQILIMPTWREYVPSIVFNNKEEDFYKTDYFQKWFEFLNSKTLYKLSEKGYKIVFNPHINVYNYFKKIKLPDFINFFDNSSNFQKSFQCSDLMITDYTSAAFEMALLQKPVIYYQFDDMEYNAKHYKKSYFSYRDDGFGGVVNNLKDLELELNKYILEPKEYIKKYLHNINKIRYFTDCQNCLRIFQAIVKISLKESK